jgi:hypothetical protein
MEDIVARAVKRGELPPSVDAGELLESLVAPAYLRLLVTGMPLDDALIERSVNAALTFVRLQTISARDRRDSPERWGAATGSTTEAADSARKPSARPRHLWG